MTSNQAPAAPRRQIVFGHGNTWHDPALAIADGERLFAEAIERHTQCKRGIEMTRPWYSWRAVKEFLGRNGAWPVADADVLAISSWTRPTVGSMSQLLDNPSLHPIIALLAGSTLLEPVSTNLLGWTLRGHAPRPFKLPDAEGPGLLPANGTRWQAKTLGHQLAHAANAVYTSPFDECVVMIVDGFGEGTALTFFHFADNRFELLAEARPGVSLGFLYGLVTQFCGFNPYEGEEWKVMGLAAFGEFRQEIYDFFRRRIAVDGLTVEFRPPAGRKAAFDTAAWRELETLVGGFRAPGGDDVLAAADLAHNFQRLFADVLVELAAGAAALGLSQNLAYAGDCALNSAANGRILAETGFTALHVPCAPADDGNALGAVLYERHLLRGEPRPPGPVTPYLGSRIDEERLDRMLKLGRLPHRRLADPAALADEVADRLAAGRIVAWVQGRAEFGPRALGNRSILADPRSPEMKDRINREVKFREMYRPLAPAILEEHVDEYFEAAQPSYYMERTLKYRPQARDRVPAVVHRNGTGRLQTVGKEWNPRFRGLLEAFHRKTGVPILMNTSFNVMGKPIVHSPEDAIAVFFSTGLDDLVIHDALIEK